LAFAPKAQFHFGYLFPWWLSLRFVLVFSSVSSTLLASLVLLFRPPFNEEFRSEYKIFHSFVAGLQ
jgi:hypothetical protein